MVPKENRAKRAIKETQEKEAQMENLD